MAYEIDSNVSLKAATRKERLALHSANIGKFVRVGTSQSPRTTPKPPKFGKSVKVGRHGTIEDRPPLSIDPLFRTFKGDSKAARIKHTGKRAGPRKKSSSPMLGLLGARLFEADLAKRARKPEAETEAN